MLRQFRRTALATSFTLMLIGFSTTPMADASHANIDLGPTAGAQAGSVTLILKLHNQSALENYIQDTVTPGSAHFQQFLSTSQFASQYGASATEIAQVQAFLKQHGLTGQVLDSHQAIRVNGTLAQLGAALGTSIHNYVLTSTGRQFHRPTTSPSLPSAIANLVVATTGLSNERQYVSHRLKAKQQPNAPAAPQLKAKSAAVTAEQASSAASGNPTATGVPGQYTVGDVANFYNINPLYKRGITGKGSTIAIVTLSDFYPADAETYWSDIGLKTKPNRITKVAVDGGASIDGGSGETSLDVEQSGGLAPDADIIVYHAPNAGNGFTDAFAQAVSDNKADSISASWGGPEIFNFAALNVTGASDTDTTDVGDLQAFHQIFLEAAVQGQSLFASSGDSGAYDTVEALACGDPAVHPCGSDYSSPLTVDSPASDPYITAAGGTTRPYSYSFDNGPTASISQESVWGWDYIQNYFATKLHISIDAFSTGGGGGVSVYWQTPLYQRFTSGIRNSENQQALTVTNAPSAGSTTLLQLPSHFQGRNVPDIALNADPETGYLFVSTVDGGVNSGEGGTSFVAPQLNGISALLRQSSQHRIGLWNPQVYLLQNIFGYGQYTPFHDIRQGDNWFYQGKRGYDPGAGIGTLDVANLDVFIKSGLFSFSR